MRSGGEETYPVEVLIAALSEDRGDLTRAVAALWTWLERHQQKLGSLREKYPAIVAEANAAPEFEGFTDAVFEALAEDPLRGAAELLARINLTVGHAGWPEIEYTSDIDGKEVIVAWRLSALVDALVTDRRLPAVANEYPSPAALAPLLTVCPIQVNGIAVEVQEPETPGWNVAMRKLDVALAREGPLELSVHMDTLGDHGISGLSVDGDRQVGRFEQMDGDDETQCIEAAKRAVQEVAKKAAQETADDATSVLVLPELAATQPVLEAIANELRDTRGGGPLFTIVGLRHCRSGAKELEPDPLAGKTGFAEYVNEAVVLGPDGGEVWRHKKLTVATAKVKGEGEKREYMAAEDIQLGDTLVVTPTPLGTITAIICMDTIAAHGRARLLNSPANVLIVPSLSRTVLRHRLSLQHLVQALWGVAFVCNRWIEKGSWNAEPSRSFWVVPQSGAIVPDEKGPNEHPSFVFTLGDHEPSARAI
jgi:predicted amidohydrolase